jgi:hypothetical protein
MKKFLISDGIERPEMFWFEKRNKVIIREIDRDFFNSKEYIWRTVVTITNRVRDSVLNGSLNSVFEGKSEDFIKIYNDLPNKLGEFNRLMHLPINHRLKSFMDMGENWILSKDLQKIDSVPNIHGPMPKFGPTETRFEETKQSNKGRGQVRKVSGNRFENKKDMEVPKEKIFADSFKKKNVSDKNIERVQEAKEEGGKKDQEKGSPKEESGDPLKEEEDEGKLPEKDDVENILDEIKAEKDTELRQELERMVEGNQGYLESESYN